MGRKRGQRAASGQAPDDSEPTSERVTVEEYMTSEADYVIYCLHASTYAFAARYTSGRRVLDLGCGTGYGAKMLAETAKDVVGVDMSARAISQATASYAAENLHFEQIDSVPGHELPFADGRFDVVLSSQVIEHIQDAAGYLREVQRVLRPDGTFICVTPDRTMRLWSGQRPWNKFHVTEYRPDRLASLLRDVFPEVTTLGMTAADRIIGHELRRYRRARLRAYPFTFPGSPEWWRHTGFAIAERRARRRPLIPPGPPRTFDFGPEDILISATAQKSVNIVAVARNTTAPRPDEQDHQLPPDRRADRGRLGTRAPAQRNTSDLSRRIRLARALVSVLFRHPTELGDRVVGAVERAREDPAPFLEAPIRVAVDAAHQAIGIEDCHSCAAELDETRAAVSSRLPASYHHDGGAALAEILWVIVRHRRPATVVETGVARGVSTAFILDAMARNEHGHLWSIDLPPLDAPAAAVGIAVDPSLRSRWTYVRGASRRRLRPLVGQLGTLDMFVHDGLHTTPTMLAEMRSVWPHLSEKGLIVCDDAGYSRAVLQFCEEITTDPFLTRAADKDDVVAVIPRSGGQGRP